MFSDFLSWTLPRASTRTLLILLALKDRNFFHHHRPGPSDRLFVKLEEVSVQSKPKSLPRREELLHKEEGSHPSSFHHKLNSRISQDREVLIISYEIFLMNQVLLSSLPYVSSSLRAARESGEGERTCPRGRL